MAESTADGTVADSVARVPDGGDGEPKGDRRTVLLAVAYGVAVRDVLRSDTYRELKAAPDVRLVVMAPEAENREFQDAFGGTNVEFEVLERPTPTLLERLLFNFQRALLRPRLRTIALGNLDGMNLALRVLTPVAGVLTSLLGRDRVTRIVGWVHRNLVRPRMYEDVFRRHRPDVVVVTRVLKFSWDYPVMKRAHREGIPTIILVASWDNLTSKGFYSEGADRLIVWNAIMKQEAIDYYDFPPEKILIAGIPRMDAAFKRQDPMSRREFAARHNLDPEVHIVTYTTGSLSFATTRRYPRPTEPLIIERLAGAIADGTIPHAQLLVRLHPQADPSEFRHLMEDSAIRWQVPGVRTAFHDRLLSREEERVFRETLAHSDVIVNIASTITIDAAVFDTPVVCVGFDIDGPRPLLHSIRRLYQFEHYAKLAETAGFRLAQSPAHLVELVNNYLENPARDRAGRARIVREFCRFSDGQSGERVAKSILDFSRSLPPTDRN